MKLKITLDDRTFEVDVEVAETDHSALPPSYPVGSALLSGQLASAPAAPSADPAANPGGHTAAPAANEAKVCRSPVTGIVVNVLASAGQTLQEGDSLMVLEAMKMETNISAPMAGKLLSVDVKPGDNVKSGEVLVTFE